MARLVRKQVYLSEAQEQRLKLVARREQRAEAEILREALDRLLFPEDTERRKKRRDPLWDIVGLGRTRTGDVAQNVDRHLYARPKKR